MECEIAECENEASITVNGYDICEKCSLIFVDEQIKRNKPAIYFIYCSDRLRPILTIFLCSGRL